MNKKAIFVGAVAAILILCSCGKSPCARSLGLRFAFVAFTQAETDTVLLKKYVKGGNFTTIMDSVLIDTVLLKFVNRNDTLFPSMLHIQTLLLSQYDYRIEVPAINKTYSITDIVEEEKKWKHSPFAADNDCVNPITSYTLGGQAVPVAPFHEIVYLHK
jgi:hypothetical protein